MRDEFAVLAEAALDQVLVGSPFDRTGADDESEDGTVREDAAPDAPDGAAPWPAPTSAVHLLWCASSSEVARVLPGLWRQVRHHDPGATGCLDLVVDVDVLGRLVAADVEMVELSALLAGVGDDAGAAAAAELPGLRAEVAIPAVADLLERLLLAAR